MGPAQPHIRHLIGCLSAAAAAVCLAWTASARAQADNQWASNGPAGQTLVRDLVIDPLFPDTVYAATSPGTVYRSLDRGGTWTQIGAAIADAVNALAIDPQNSAIIYAGTQTSGVYKSTDRGATWAAANTGLPDPLISALVVDPVTPSRLFAGTTDSVFVTTDSGANWATAGLPNVQVSSIVLDANRPDTLYVATDGAGIYRTYDGAATWQQVNNGLGSLRVMALALHPSAPDRIYAGTIGAGIYRSTSRGDAWTSAGTGLSDTDIVTIAITPASQNILYAGSTGVGHVYKSSDAADTWLDLTRNLPSEPVVDALTVRPDSASVVYVGISAVYRMRQVGLDSITVISTGPSPRTVTQADLDGDDTADLISPNNGENTVSVFLTRDDGALFLRNDYRAGSGPVVAAAGDLDGDGDLDLVVGNSTKRTISVLFNDSTGVFSLPVDFFVGAAVSAVALADLDSDGDLDVSVGDSDQGDLRVYLNDGRGSFEAPSVHGIGSNISGLLAADLTGNGLSDLAALSRGKAELTILANQGNAALSAGDPLPVGSDPEHMVSGDWDLDGDIDLALTLSNGPISVLYNDGAGNLTDSANHDVSETPAGLQTADVDQDGYLDLIVPLTGGEVRTLVNDGDGAFPTWLSMGSATGPGGVVGADVSGDGIADVAIARPDADAITILRNNVAQSIKSPGVPRNTAALDRGGDLGGNVDVTWERPRVDETTGRISRYRIFRADSEAGPFAQVAAIDTGAAHSIDSTGVYRSYTDSSATVDQAYYYYVQSENTAGDVSASSDTVSASSRPQPFFDFVFSGNSPFHVLDTISVQARLNPIGHDIQSFSLYLDYDPDAFTLLDADPAESGTQPVSVDSILAGNSRVLQNRLDPAGVGKVNYGLGFLPETADVPLPVGTLRFVALKDTLTQIRVVYDTTTVRRTALTTRGDGAFVQPYIPPPSLLVLRNFRVRGQVSLQGRSTDLDLPARFDLTLVDSAASGAPLPDSIAYQPPNDMDLLLNGVQTVLAANGGFSLEQVPPGTYGLFVKTFHYLRGRIATDSLVVNDSLGVTSTVSFEWISEDSSIVSSALRAGDANNDNRADLADFGLLAANFGATEIVEGSPAWGADFNGDGAVNLVDFTLLQSNFGEAGMGPSVPAKPATTPARFALARDSDAPDEAFLVGSDARNAIGFSVDLSFAPGVDVPSDGIRPGSFFQPAGGRLMTIVRRLRRDGRRVLRVAGALSDPGQPVGGSGKVFTIDLESGISLDDVRLENPQILDVSGAVLPANPVAGPGARPDAAPTVNALLQNYPNPFNPETTIPFSVATSATVSLRIYSPIGQHIRSVISDRYGAGQHRAVWDGLDDSGRRVASGVYLYRLSIGNWDRVRKLLLLR